MKYTPNSLRIEKVVFLGYIVDGDHGSVPSLEARGGDVLPDGKQCQIIEIRAQENIDSFDEPPALRVLRQFRIQTAQPGVQEDCCNGLQGPTVNMLYQVINLPIRINIGSQEIHLCHLFRVHDRQQDFPCRYPWDCLISFRQMTSSLLKYSLLFRFGQLLNISSPKYLIQSGIHFRLMVYWFVVKLHLIFGLEFASFLCHCGVVRIFCVQVYVHLGSLSTALCVFFMFNHLTN